MAAVVNASAAVALDFRGCQPLEADPDHTHPSTSHVTPAPQSFTEKLLTSVATAVTGGRWQSRKNSASLASTPEIMTGPTAQTSAGSNKRRHAHHHCRRHHQSASSLPSSQSRANGIEETLLPPGDKASSHCRIFSVPPPPPPPDGTKFGRLSSTVFVSTDSLNSTGSFCRICHSSVNHPDEPLIAPCRCSGSMRFVHTSCLIRWLEVSSQKYWPTANCELCGFRFRRHPVYWLRKLHFPTSTPQDKAMNGLCVFLLGVMAVCGVLITKYSRYSTGFVQPSKVVKIGNVYFNIDELLLAASITFFLIAFVVAFATQYRKGSNIPKLFVRFYSINRNWQIRDYNPLTDEAQPPTRDTSSDTLLPR